MNIQPLYRDTTLPASIIAVYKPGMTIIERGFTDASALRGGPVGTLRYLIITQLGKDLSIVSPEVEKWRLTVLPSGTIFRVLDVQELSGVTQVVLSTLPPEVDEVFIKKARSDFEALRSVAPVASLATPEWANRVQYPLGLADDGVPFPLPTA